MATRLSPKHDELTRSKIQTSQLLNRLNKFALDEENSVRMTSDQVRAALGLLRKTIPDLAVTTHTGPDGGPVEYSFSWAPQPPQINGHAVDNTPQPLIISVERSDAD